MQEKNRSREDDAFQIFEDTFYEIEYDSCPMPGVGKFVLKSRKIEEPERDEIRERFNQMRNIARENRRYHYGGTKFYDKRVQEENSRIFYLQGKFMEEFRDEYDKISPYSSYFPDYQTMGYEQLRTYFSWRTKVRQGDIDNISLSYAFLYLYELIGNIGVESPEEGLEKIMDFWDAFRVYDQSIDKYVLKWLKDYHIFYELPWSFQEFVEKNELKCYYPNLDNSEDCFDLYVSISKYDIRKSAFYVEKEDLVRNCFQFLIDRLKDVFEDGHIDFEDYVFQPVKNSSAWTPFQSALFYSPLKQRDRRVVLSEKEIYICSAGRWTFSTAITTGTGKQLIGYCMKQMESILRSLAGYRHKLTANISMISDLTEEELGRAGINLEKVIDQAVREYYREATKTVVKVDAKALDKIRQEAYVTQEKLTVPEEDVLSSIQFYSDSVQKKAQGKKEEFEQKKIQSRNQSLDGSAEKNTSQNQDDQGREWRQDASDNVWDALWSAFTQTEREALLLVLSGEKDIKKFADEKNIMLEVLLDNINEKAVDVTGDAVLDDEFAVYDDYYEQVKEMVSRR